MYICDWILENRPNCHTGPIPFYWPMQLMATLIHYTFTLPLSGLVDWSAFLERLLPTLYIHDWDNGTHGGRYMEGMGVKFTPGIGGRMLRHSSEFGHMAGTSGTQLVQTVLTDGLARLRLPTHPLHPPLPSPPTRPPL